MSERKDLLNPITLPGHIRIKRHKLTLFLHTDLRVDTVLVLKERIEKLTGVPVMKQRLYYNKQLVQNPATLWDSGIETDDAELVLVFSTGIGPGDVDVWEDRTVALEGPQAPPLTGATAAIAAATGGAAAAPASAPAGAPAGAAPAGTPATAAAAAPAPAAAAAGAA
jgi:hypothetical protein